jgi:hypothetical protein
LNAVLKHVGGRDRSVELQTAEMAGHSGFLPSNTMATPHWKVSKNPFLANIGNFIWLRPISHHVGTLRSDGLRRALSLAQSTTQYNF